jgi:hypothetical protein
MWFPSGGGPDMKATYHPEGDIPYLRFKDKLIAREVA